MGEKRRKTVSKTESKEKKPAKTSQHKKMGEWGYKRTSGLNSDKLGGKKTSGAMPQLLHPMQT